MTEFYLQRPQLVPFARYRWDKIREQHQIVYPEGVLVLNKTGAEIVQRMDGRTLDTLVTDLETAFDEDGIRLDVLDFLRGLYNHGLLKRDD